MFSRLIFGVSLAVSAFVFGGAIYYAYNPEPSISLHYLPKEIEADGVLRRGSEWHLLDGCGAFIYRLSPDWSERLGRDGISFLGEGLVSRGRPETMFGFWSTTPLPKVLYEHFIHGPESFSAMRCGQIGGWEPIVGKLASEKGSFYVLNVGETAVLIVSAEKKLAVFIYAE